MIPLLSRSGTDLESARAAPDVVPPRHASPLSQLVGHLLVVAHSADLVVVRPMGGRLAPSRDLAALLAVLSSDVGEIAAGTLPRIARERGVA